MPVRLATTSRQDRKFFLSLWQDMEQELYDSYELGTELPTPENLNAYRKVYDLYTTGFRSGVVLFWEPEPNEEPAGVFMGGEPISAETFDARWRRPAWIHGIYVKPEFRVRTGWKRLYRAAMRELTGLGFSHVKGFVNSYNDMAYRMNRSMGGQVYGILMEMSLED